MAAPLALVLGTATSAGATSVGNELGFKLAFGNPAETSITLANDIHFTCGGGGPSFRNSATAISIDGAGHTIFQDCPDSATLVQLGAGALTVQSTRFEGGNAAIVSVNGAGAAITIANSTIADLVGSSSVAGVVAVGGSGTAAVTLIDTAIANVHSPNSIGIATIGGLSITKLSNSSISNIASAAGTGSATGIATVGLGGAATSLTNSAVDGVTGTGGAAAAGVAGVGGGPSPSGNVSLDRSTVANVTGAAPSTIAVIAIGDLAMKNSTVSNNTGGVVSINDTSLVYSDVVSNGGVAATAVSARAARHIQLPANAGTLDLPGPGPGPLQAPTSAQLISVNDLTSFGSVVALPQGGVDNCDVVGSTTSHGFNFSDDATCGFTQGTDHQNAGDPGLGALGDNGGPTPTRLPQTGSPLIDAIPTASCQADGAAGVTDDQRGVTRPQGPGCDIGAVEVEVIVVTPKFTG